MSQRKLPPTEVLKQQALTAVRSNKLIFIAEIFSFTNISRSSFYKLFPTDSEDYRDITHELDKNKIQMKVALRKKWYQSQNSNLQIMLMRIICSEEERKYMSQKFVDIESAGEKLNSGIDISKLSIETLEELKKLYQNNEE